MFWKVYSWTKIEGWTGYNNTTVFSWLKEVSYLLKLFCAIGWHVFHALLEYDKKAEVTIFKSLWYDQAGIRTRDLMIRRWTL